MQCNAVVPTTVHFSDCIALFHLFTRFCQSKGPNSFKSLAKTLTIRFNSNKRKEGEGAECSVACSDLTPTSGTLVRESSYQLKHKYLLWVKRRGKEIDMVRASQPKGFPVSIPLNFCQDISTSSNPIRFGN